jgi:hypothetical protein
MSGWFQLLVSIYVMKFLLSNSFEPSKLDLNRLFSFIIKED